MSDSRMVRGSRPTHAGGEASQGAVKLRVSKKAVVAGSIGHVIEFYDFSIYAFFATTIAVNFFPTGNPTVGLLATFGVFVAGSLMRILGGIIFGSLGDRVGRKKALAASILLMGIGTLVIAVSPGYSSIGVLAPALLLIGRCLQGLSSGGEWGGAVSYLTEHAPPGRRGLYGSWQQVSGAVGVLVAAGIAAMLASTLSPSALESYGWRIGFASGALACLVALYLRLRAEESPEFRALEESGGVQKAPFVSTLRNHWRPVLAAAGVLMAFAVGWGMVWGYLPAHLDSVTSLGRGPALTTLVIAVAVAIVLEPISGLLSDRIGCRPLILTGAWLILVLSFPAFNLMSRGEFLPVLLGELALVVPLAVMSGPAPALLAKFFPTEVRYTGVSTVVNFDVGVFASTGPLIATALVAASGSVTGPAYYVAALALVSLVFGFVIRWPSNA